MTYLWFKAVHILSALTFVSGTMALLFVSTALEKHMAGGRSQAVALKAVVLFWDRRITVPAMVATWVFGLWVAMCGDWFSNGWLQAKLLLVVILSAFTVSDCYCECSRDRPAGGPQAMTGNGTPTGQT